MTVGAAGFTVMITVVEPVFPDESVTVKVRVCVPTSFDCMFLTVRSKSFSVSVLVVCFDSIRDESSLMLRPKPCIKACALGTDSTFTSSLATM